jgi:hypothetical protein
MSDEQFDRHVRRHARAGLGRATVETSAMMKNPPVYARQANIAQRPQQVSSGVVNNGHRPATLDNMEAPTSPAVVNIARECALTRV